MSAQQVVDMIHDLAGLYAQTTPGKWGKGQTSHHTVSRREGQPPYRIAEFHHAHDAAFCDAAHTFMPTLLEVLRAHPLPVADETGALIYKLECFIDHATGGKLSKSSWALETLKSAFDDHLRACIEQALAEDREGRS